MVLFRKRFVLVAGNSRLTVNLITFLFGLGTKKIQLWHIDNLCTLATMLSLPTILNNVWVSRKTSFQQSLRIYLHFCYQCSCKTRKTQYNNKYFAELFLYSQYAEKFFCWFKSRFLLVFVVGSTIYKKKKKHFFWKHQNASSFC